MIEDNLRVLLVEDDQGLRESLARYLRKDHGYIVDLVASGEEALPLLEASNGHYNVALVDGVLGAGLNGLDILKEIKARYPNIEVILFTAYGMSSALEALRAGAYRYFAKPFDRDELAITIRIAAEQGQARRERQMLAALNKVSDAINSTLEVEEILRLACQAVVELLGVDHSGLVMFEADYSFGRVKAEYPNQVPATHESMEGIIIPVRGIPAEERLVYHREVLNFPDVVGEISLGKVRDDILCRFGIRSVLIVPVISRDRVVASFSLDAIRQPRVFREAEIELCQRLANQLGVAIENARLFQEVSQGVEYLESLYKASNQIISSEFPEEVLQSVVDVARQATEAQRVLALLFDEQEHPLVLAKSGAKYRSDPAANVRSDGISVYVLRLARPYFIPDVSAPNQPISPNPGMQIDAVKAAACLPMPLKGKNIGVLWVEFGEVRNFPEGERKALQLFANQSAIAYNNARRMQELERLRDAIEKMAGVAEIRDVLQQMVDSAREVLGADYTLLWPYDQARDVFFPEELVASGISSPLLDQFREKEPEVGQATRQVLQTGYIAVTDIAGPEAKFMGQRTHSAMEDLGVKSVQGISVDVGEDKLGVLFVDYKELRSFSQEDKRILETFARHAALALKKSRLLDQVIRAREAARAVAKLSAIGELKETMNSIVQSAKKVLRCDVAILYSFDEEKHSFMHVAGEGYRHWANLCPPEQVTEMSLNLWKVINLEEPFWLVLENSSEIDLSKSNFVRGEEIKSSLAILLRAGLGRVGALFVNYRTPHRFKEDELDDAKLFADQAAIAIRNAQLHAETSRRAKALNGLYNAGMAITGTLSLEATLNEIARQALDVIGVMGQVEGCSSQVALLEGDKLHFVAANTPEILGQLEQEISEIDLLSSPKIGIVGRTVKEGKSQCVGDTTTDPDFIPFAANVLSELSVPINFVERVVGTISIEHPQRNAFTLEDQHNVELLAAQAAVAIRNAQMFARVASVREASRVVAQMSTIGELTETMQSIVESAKLVLHCDVVVLYSFDEAKRNFTHAKGAGLYNEASLRSPENVTEESVLWKVMDLLEPFRLDAQNAPDPDFFKGNFSQKEKVRSALAILLHAGGRRVGALFINYRTPHSFEEDELNDAKLFADQAAVAIRNAQLHAETGRRAKAFQGLYHAGMAITGALSLEVTLNEIAKQALQVIGVMSRVEGCSSHVALLEGDRLRFVAANTPEILGRLEQEIDEIDLRTSPKIGIVGRTVKEGRSQCVGDTTTDRDFIPFASNVHSVLAVPINFGGRVVGTISIDHPEREAFTLEDRYNVELLAAQAAVAIRNAGLYRRAQEGRAYLGSLYEASSRIISPGNPEQVLQDIVSFACRATGAWRTVALSLDERGHSRVLAEHTEREVGYRLDPEKHIRPDGNSVYVMRSGQSRFISDTRLPDEHISPNPGMVHNGIRAAACLAMSLMGKNIGVLWVEFKEPQAFLEDERKALQLFANHSAVAYSNAKQHDALHALYNAGKAITGNLALEETLHRICEQASRIVEGDPSKDGCCSFLSLLEGETLNWVSAFPDSALKAPQAINLQKSSKVGIAGRAALTGQSQLVSDVSADPDYIELNPRTHSELAVPIKLADQVIGVINVEHPDLAAFGAEDRQNLESLAAQAAVAIENADQMDELARANQELQELDRARTQLLSVVSHELQTPLTLMQSIIENLLEELHGPLTEKQRYKMKVMLSSINREAQLHQALLDLIPENRMTLNLERESIVRIVNEVFDDSEDRAIKRNIRSLKELPEDDLLYTDMDSNKVRYVLTVLVDNALKFTLEGGTITVKAFHGEGEIEIQVRDTGIGIPADDLDKIFDPFYQSSRQFGGMGMGLSIAKKYVAEHGGHIWAESVLNEGSAFFFTLPKPGSEKA